MVISKVFRQLFAQNVEISINLAGSNYSINSKVLVGQRKATFNKSGKKNKTIHDIPLNHVKCRTMQDNVGLCQPCKLTIGS